jgi:rhodanese-related sulfurtransferase
MTRLPVLAALLVAFSNPAVAQGTPARPQAPAVVTGEQLKAAIDARKKLLVVDTRTPDEFAQAHIAGSVNVPAGFVRALSNRLPKDKGTLLVFYCRGMGCTLSPEAAAEAAGLGYTNLAIYQAGIPDWLLKRYPVETGPAPTKSR